MMMTTIKRIQSLVIDDITPKEFATYFVGADDLWQSDVLEEIANQFYEQNLEMQILFFTTQIGADSRFWWFLNQIEEFSDGKS